MSLNIRLVNCIFACQGLEGALESAPVIPKEMVASSSAWRQWQMSCSPGAISFPLKCCAGVSNGVHSAINLFGGCCKQEGVHAIPKDAESHLHPSNSHSGQQEKISAAEPSH